MPGLRGHPVAAGALLALVALSPLLAPSGARAGAAVTIRPAAGPPGTALTLSATGLRPGRAGGLRPGRAPARRAVVDRRGRFAVALQVPPRVTGTWPLVLRQGAVRVVSHFRVARRAFAGSSGEIAAAGGAAVRWTATHRASATGLRLLGSGFPARARVRVRWLGRTATRQADAHGRLTARLPVRRAAAGPRPVAVIQAGRVRLSFAVGDSIPAHGVGAPVVLAPPRNSSAPTLSGTAMVGHGLVADAGGWTGTVATFAFRWLRCDGAGNGCAEVPGATRSEYPLHDADAGHAIRVVVTAANPGGATAATSAPSAGVAAVPASGADPVIAAAGDVACSPADGNFNGGAGSASACRQMATSDLLTVGGLAAVLPLGDMQYECPTASGLAASYDPSWGRVKAISHPVPGNHEYIGASRPGCTNAVDAYYAYFGAAAGNPATGYYSYDIGSWHVIALNTNTSCSVIACSAGSAQEQWLRADLAAHPSACTLAYFHEPLFTSGVAHEGGTTAVRPFWDALQAAGAEVILNGHVHNYERFAPQTPTGAPDPAGIREVVVGTGGKSHYAVGAPVANSEVRSADAFGVLRMTLHPDGYDWAFVPAAGSTFTDSGSSTCH